MLLPPLTRQVFFRILGLVTTIVSFVSIAFRLFGDNAVFGIGGLFLGAAIAITALRLKSGASRHWVQGNSDLVSFLLEFYDLYWLFMAFTGFRGNETLGQRASLLG
jgi:hypothetical protein